MFVLIWPSDYGGLSMFLSRLQLQHGYDELSQLEFQLEIFELSKLGEKQIPSMKLRLVEEKSG